VPFWELFYHFVWATQGRAQVIDTVVEPHLYQYIENKTASYEGSVIAIGGTPDHVHLVVSLPPKVAPAVFIGAVKGSASRYLNQSSPALQGFRWQTEYSVLSLSQQQLPKIVGYVQRQKEHHRAGELDCKLEPPDDTDAS